MPYRNGLQNRNGSATVDHVTRALKAAQQRYADVIQENRDVCIVIRREG
jgi:putative NIF3 family GTP cyclohydrolase 1 type 2